MSLTSFHCCCFLLTSSFFSAAAFHLSCLGLFGWETFKTFHPLVIGACLWRSAFVNKTLNLHRWLVLCAMSAWNEALSILQFSCRLRLCLDPNKRYWVRLSFTDCLIFPGLPFVPLPFWQIQQTD